MHTTESKKRIAMILKLEFVHGALARSVENVSALFHFGIDSAETER